MRRHPQHLAERAPQQLIQLLLDELAGYIAVDPREGDGRRHADEQRAEWLARFDAAMERAEDEAGWRALNANETSGGVR